MGNCTRLLNVVGRVRAGGCASGHKGEASEKKRRSLIFDLLERG